MKQLIGDILAPLADFLFNLVVIVPISAVRVLVFVILAALAVWVICMPAQLPEGTARDKTTAFRDLRFFALAVIGLQAILYLMF